MRIRQHYQQGYGCENDRLQELSLAALQARKSPGKKKGDLFCSVRAAHRNFQRFCAMCYVHGDPFPVYYGPDSKCSTLTKYGPGPDTKSFD